VGHRKAVKTYVMGGMHGDQLPMKVGRRLGDFHAVFATLTCDFVILIAAFCSLFQIEQTDVPTEDLHAFVAAIGGPFGNAVPAVERGRRRPRVVLETGPLIRWFHADYSIYLDVAVYDVFQNFLTARCGLWVKIVFFCEGSDVFQRFARRQMIGAVPTCVACIAWAL